jgi:hypothetical protein
MPAWEKVKEVNIPMAYRGSMRLSSARKATVSTAAAADRARTPVEYTSR